MSQVLQTIFHEHGNVVPSESYQIIIKKLPFLGSPVPVVLLTLCYLIFVLLIGPIFMRNRKPYNLKNVILIYNFLQIIINFWLCYWFVSTFYTHRADVPDFGCLTTFPHSPSLEKVNVYGLYTYYILKLVDYIETIFFVLRKSFKQVSFLHVYHHSMLVLSSYFVCANYGAAGHYAGFIVLNTAVHAVMYTYYFVSALRPNMKMGLWWKKYITIFQLTQFLLMVMHYSYTLLFRSTCAIPKGLLLFSFSQVVTMIVLFGNFYRRTYLRRDRMENLAGSSKRSVKSN